MPNAKITNAISTSNRENPRWYFLPPVFIFKPPCYGHVNAPPSHTAVPITEPDCTNPVVNTLTD